jgi:hypothetical protein
MPLSYDEAWLNLVSQAPITYSIWTQSEECYNVSMLATILYFVLLICSIQRGFLVIKILA